MWDWENERMNMTKTKEIEYDIPQEQVHAQSTIMKKPNILWAWSTVKEQANKS